MHGMSAPRTGKALFPMAENPGATGGSEPIFNATDDQIVEATANGSHSVLDAYPLVELTVGKTADLLHIDVQGGELEFVRQNISDINSSVRGMVIGTHSRHIEGILTDFMLSNGWDVEMDRPALVRLVDGRPQIYVDGVQAW